MTRIPRAIAPLVDEHDVVAGARGARAASAQMRSMTSARSSPESSATMLDPSLMT